MFELYVQTARDVSPVVRNETLKKEEHCDQHSSGGVAVLVSQYKKGVTMISTYHKVKMCVAVNKASQEERKPVHVCSLNVNMFGVERNDQLQQTHKLE